jgi:calcineurin-like phosphoesterase
MRLSRLFLLVSILIFSIFIGTFIYSSYRGPVKRYIEKKKQEKYANIRVEVLNATGISGLSRKITFRLREMGFDVVYYGNTREILDKTVVVERVSPEMTNAKLVAKEIGCSIITFEPDPNKLLEVTLVVGKDYENYFEGIDKEIFY